MPEKPKDAIQPPAQRIPVAHPLPSEGGAYVYDGQSLKPATPEQPLAEEN